MATDLQLTYSKNELLANDACGQMQLLPTCLMNVLVLDDDLLSYVARVCYLDQLYRIPRALDGWSSLKRGRPFLDAQYRGCRPHLSNLSTKFTRFPLFEL